MRYLLFAALVVATPLAAQGQPGQSARPMPRALRGGAIQTQDTVAANLRQRVMTRFMQTYRIQAGLTDRQFVQFRREMRRTFEERAALQRRQRTLYLALEGQMRPGVAADADSVRGLLDGLERVQQEQVDQFKAERKAYAEFLNPVQVAQLVLAWQRLQQQVQQVLQRRRF